MKPAFVEADNAQPEVKVSMISAVEGMNAQLLAQGWIHVTFASRRGLVSVFLTRQQVKELRLVLATALDLGQPK